MSFPYLFEFLLSARFYIWINKKSKQGNTTESVKKPTFKTYNNIYLTL